MKKLILLLILIPTICWSNHHGTQLKFGAKFSTDIYGQLPIGAIESGIYWLETLSAEPLKVNSEDLLLDFRGDYNLSPLYSELNLSIGGQLIPYIHVGLAYESFTFFLSNPPGQSSLVNEHIAKPSAISQNIYKHKEWDQINTFEVSYKIGLFREANQLFINSRHLLIDVNTDLPGRSYYYTENLPIMKTDQFWEIAIHGKKLIHNWSLGGHFSYAITQYADHFFDIVRGKPPESSIIRRKYNIFAEINWSSTKIIPMVNIYQWESRDWKFSQDVFLGIKYQTTFETKHIF